VTRTTIQKFPLFSDADRLRGRLEAENPGVIFQVRRQAGGFVVVRRDV